MELTNLHKGLVGAISIVNGEEMLRSIDLPALVEEVKNIDVDGANKLAEDMKLLDLINDDLEAKIEAYAQAGAYWAPYVSQILKLILPKMVQQVSGTVK